MQIRSLATGGIIGFFALFASVTSAATPKPPEPTTIADLLIRFCNDPVIAKNGGTKDLLIQTVPGKDEDICIYLVNGGATPVTALVGFVDASISTDGEGTKTCAADGMKNNFGKFVTTETQAVDLPAKSTVEMHAKVKFPADVAGMVYGCVTAQISGSASVEHVFQGISRRANFIDVAVKGLIRSSIKIVNQTLPVGFTLHNTDNHLYVISNPETKELRGKVLIENDGNIPQYVSIQPTAQRIAKTVTMDTISQKIAPEQQTEFLIPLTRPLWQGPVQLDLSISYTPVVEDGFPVDATFKANTENLHVSTKALFMPWNILFILLGIILLGLLAPILFGNTKKQKTIKQRTLPAEEKTPKKKKRTTK